MKKNSNVFVIIQLVIFQVIIFLIGEHKVLSQKCSEGFVPFKGACDECGLSYVSPNVRTQALIPNKTISESKIVGGIAAKANSWPAQALLYIKGKLCGGSLIRRNVVLTAAHCAVISKVGSDYQVYLGAHGRTRLTSSGVFKTSVSKVIVHPGYNSKTVQNDIAILILSQAATLSKKIQLACLPPASTTFPSANVASWIVGWGTTSSGGKTSNLLQNAKIKVLNPTTACSKYPTVFWNSQVCAGLTDGGKDSCQGDSGGPLYVRGKIGGKSKYILAGVTSYGKECALKDYPGIYTRTSAYIKWILSNSV